MTAPPPPMTALGRRVRPAGSPGYGAEGGRSWRGGCDHLAEVVPTCSSRRPLDADVRGQRGAQVVVGQAGAVDGRADGDAEHEQGAGRPRLDFLSPRLSRQALREVAQGLDVLRRRDGVSLVVGFVVQRVLADADRA